MMTAMKKDREDQGEREDRRREERGGAPPAGEPVAEVTDLMAHYGEREVLHHVSLSVAPGEVRVILGPSGCGKSTLLKHMVGLLGPTAGSVRLFGQEIVGLDDEGLNPLLARVGMLFQGGALIQSMSVVENAMLPLREHTALDLDDIERVARMKLATVGLGKHVELLPSELSGGMRKRAALARAMALDPALLFCDEPTAGLDPVTAAGIDRLILDLRDALDITVIVVSHELGSIRRIADRVTMLQDGTVVADGTTAELERSSDRRIRSFFEGSPPIVPEQGENVQELFVD
jgi:phospholipid/cholesterol/gamma-HCH transport system ATP-binding protein